MRFTIFQDPITRRVMEELGVVYTSNEDDADVLVASALWMMGNFVFKPEWTTKKLLLWTHEPRFWKTPHGEALAGRRRVRIMSVYSGEVFRDNYYYSNIPRAAFEPLPRRTVPRRKV